MSANTQSIHLLTLGQKNRSLPVDLVLDIAKYMPISHVKIAVAGWFAKAADKKYVLKARSNILLYMKQFFEEPARVLDLMRACGVVWSGSRAQEFFTPGTCTLGSDLDFYCTTNSRCQYDKRTPSYGPIDVFLHVMEKMGVEWMESIRIQYAEGHSEVQWYRMAIQVILGQGELCLATSSIFEFHSTVTQCFISGFGAVSLYDNYTANGEIIHWSQNDSCTRHLLPTRYRGWDFGEFYPYKEARRVPPQPLKDSQRIIKKFMAREFKFVEYGSRGNSAHGGGDVIGVYGGRMRCIGDGGVLKISFEPYLDTSEWYIPFEVYWNALDYISWYETATKTHRIPGLLDALDFPFDRNSCVDTVDKEWGGGNQIFNLGGKGVWLDEWLAHIEVRAKKTGKYGFGDNFDEKRFENWHWTTTLTRYPC